MSRHTSIRLDQASSWLLYYGSPRMNQIQAELFSVGVREPKLGRLVLAADRLAEGRLQSKALWVDGGRFWLLFARRGFLRIKKAGRRRPTLRHVEQRLGEPIS